MNKPTITLSDFYLPIDLREFGITIYSNGLFVATDMTGYFKKNPPKTPEDRVLAYLFPEKHDEYHYACNLTFEEYCDLRELSRWAMEECDDKFVEMDDAELNANSVKLLERVERVIRREVLPQLRARQAAKPTLLLESPQKAT